MMTSNYTKDELSKIDSDRVSLGTDYQDCALIANTFERMCHSTPNEAATFAPLSRSVQNTKQMALTTKTMLSSYLRSPKQEEEERTGEQSITDNSLQGLNVGSQQTGTLKGPDFGQQVFDWLKDCVPCQLRIVTYLELHPRVDLLVSLETDILQRFRFLMDLGRSLASFNEYADLCELIKLLNFMCLPDLQRIIALLMALMLLQVGQLDSLIGFLQSLISPIFAPVLMGLTGLLDQFELLVLSPVDCIIDAVNEQMEKLGLEAVPRPEIEAITSGLQEINFQLIEAKQTIQAKVDFYVNQVNKLLGEIGAGDTSYLQFSLKKLKIIRMVGLVVSIINALSRGHAICNEQGKDPERSELDSFFATFLNPQQPFQLYIDDNGDIQVQEKIDGLTDITFPANQTSPLSNIGNVFEFDGTDLVSLPEAVSAVAVDASNVLTQPAKITVRCNIRTTAENTDQVNEWIEELDRL